LFTQEIDYEELKKIYDASADYTDDLIQQITDSLKENNLKEDTTLIIISDHGQALGEDQIFGHQFTVHPTVTDTLMMIDNPKKQSKNVEEPVELKKLHKLTPYHAGIKDKPSQITQDMVKGGYEYPSVFIGYVPKEKWSKHYKKYRYIQTEDTRTVKQFDQEGNTEIISKDLETGEEIETPEKVRNELDKIDSDNEEVENVESSSNVDDEEIKERLEALGYK
jgi:arylsulfatase A-like enzyme